VGESEAETREALGGECKRIRATGPKKNIVPMIPSMSIAPIGDEAKQAGI
jgi:hypothetical protein